MTDAKQRWRAICPFDSALSEASVLTVMTGVLLLAGSTGCAQEIFLIRPAFTPPWKKNFTEMSQ